MKIVYVGNMLSAFGYTLTTIETLAPKLNALGFEVIATSGKLNKWLRIVDVLMTIFKHRRSTNLVLLDTYSTQNFYSTLLATFLCRVLRLPYMPILHGGNLAYRLARTPAISRYIFSNSALNISPSLFLKNVFEQNGYKVTHVPNSIDLELYSFLKRTAAHGKLLWVRSFHQIYQPQLALEVVKKLRSNGIFVELCMVGPDKDGSLDSCRQWVAREGLEEVVSFKGKMEKRDWIELSASYDLFLNTTTQDNMPVSIIEAMALGFPIVSTNVGGLPFLIEHEVDGLLTPKGDVDQMCKLIQGLIENPLLVQKLSEGARQKAESFAWSKIACQWKQILNT